MATQTIHYDERPNPINRLLARAFTLDWELIAYFIILGLAIFTRFHDLGVRVMSHDESLHTKFAFDLYQNGNFQHTPLMHGPILFHATAFFYALFGDNDFTARMYPALLGVAVVMLPLLYRRWLGRMPSLLVSVMLLISPLTLYYNRYIRHDTPAIFFSLVMIYAIFMYLDGPEKQRRRSHWLYIFSAAMLGNLGSKETAFIYIAIFGSFLTLFWVIRLLQHRWNIAGKTWFYFSSLGFLLGGVGALGMFVVLTVSPFDAARAAGFGSLAFNTFFGWTLGIVAAIAVFIIGTALWVYRGGHSSGAGLRWREIALIALIALVVALFMIEVEEISRDAGTSIETAAPVVPGEDGDVVEDGVNTLPIYLAWVAGLLVVGALWASYRAGWWRALDHFPEADILIIMGTLILPWLTPFIVAATGASPTDYTSFGLNQAWAAFVDFNISQGFNLLGSAVSTDGIARSVVALVPLAAISITVGLLWNWRRWLISAAIFYALFSFFFTTMFTNSQGFASGVVGSLGYWIEQQGVRRGSQPQYYYLVLIMPFYEFLPLIGSVLAMLAGLTKFWRYRRAQGDEAAAEAEHPSVEAVLGFSAPADTDEIPEPVAARPQRIVPESARLTRVPFILFVAWWGVLNLVGYTLAGEKMPWLAIHLTLPLIFLTGWYFGNILERVSLRQFTERGWLYLLLLPLLFVAGFQVFSPLFIGPSPFGGLEQGQLGRTNVWLAALAVSGIIIYALYQIVKHTGWQHFRHMTAAAVFLTLSVITFRSAWMATFINFDLATEYLVYAHAAPAIKTVLDDLEELSLRTTDGLNLSFAYDNESSWPYSWYFRNYPNATFIGGNPTVQNLEGRVAVVVGNANRARVEPLLEDRYFHFEYNRLWWPMQDYFNLTPQRVTDFFDLTGNPQASQLRRGVFDIWWSRDYDAYGAAVGRDFDVTTWPVADRMHFYVRKDVAAQIWSLGVGEGTVQNPLEALAVNSCVSNWQPHAANLVFGASGNGPGQFNRPLGIALGSDNRLFVAEEFNNRISTFDQNGNFQASLGDPLQAGGSAFFTRPNGVHIGADGNIYIADTWNYRVQVFTPDGEPLASWGRPEESGFDVLTEPVDGFWGPRDVLVDDEGRVYVADTGNKRIRVYTSQGEFLRDIGSGGSGPGELNEPAGLALHPDGRLFVADTWNRRVTIFDTDGQFVDSWDVRAWFDERGNRPYLALDPARDLLYVTDPDAARVLVYNTQGECQGSFGQPGADSFNETQFDVVGGIVADSDGQVYVADAGSMRILRFPPFDYPVPESDAGDAAENGA